jgi:predicted RNase H-like HicB family nuclease
MKPKDILKKPYKRILYPDSGGEAWNAYIYEFPGCFACGYTAEETLQILEDVAKSWLYAVIELGQDVPEPTEIPDIKE